MKLSNLILALAIFSITTFNTAQAQTDGSQPGPSVTYDVADFPSTEGASKVKLSSAALSLSSIRSMFRGVVADSVAKMCEDCSSIRVNAKIGYPRALKASGDSSTIFNRKFLVSSDGNGGLNLAENPAVGRTLFKINSTYNNIPVELELYYRKASKTEVSKVKTTITLAGNLR